MNIDKERVKFILDKKKIITILVIFILLFILFVFIDININPYPPKVIFIDKESNDLLDGKVLLDNEYIGDTENGEFKNLPDNFCKKENTINLELEDFSYSWQSFPSDCELNYILFKVEKEKILKKKEIIMKFFIKETKEPITGELYFDNELVDEVNGTYTVDMDTCNSISLIKIETENDTVEWKHHSVLCDRFDIIDYSIGSE